MRVWYILHPDAGGNGRWRWAIHLDQPSPQTPLAGIVNAGNGFSRQLADRDGQQALYTVLVFATMVGFDRPQVVNVVWDVDPFAGREVIYTDTPFGAVGVPI